MTALEFVRAALRETGDAEEDGALKVDEGKMEVEYVEVSDNVELGVGVVPDEYEALYGEAVVGHVDDDDGVSVIVENST